MAETSYLSPATDKALPGVEPAFHKQSWSADANSYQNNDTCGKLSRGKRRRLTGKPAATRAPKTPNNLKVPLSFRVDMSSAQSVDRSKCSAREHHHRQK